MLRASLARWPRQRERPVTWIITLNTDGTYYMLTDNYCLNIQGVDSKLN